MLSTLELTQAAVLGTLLIYAYAGYSALSIRRILGVGSPRRQALGVALMASAFALFSADVVILSPVSVSPTTPVLALLQIFFFIASVTLFYWVDSSVIVARRSDPHSRDTFRWSSTRRFLWGTIGTAVGISIGVLGYLVASGTPPINAASSPIPPLGFLNTLVPFLTASISGTLALPVVARRSKDATLRKHFQWFFLFVVGQLAFFLAPLLIAGPALGDPSVAIPIWGLANLVCGYCLFRSAKSLVPLHRFPAEDESTS